MTLAYGAYRASRPDLYAQAVQLLGGVTVFDFDGAAAAESYGRIRDDLEGTGQHLVDPDLRMRPSRSSTRNW